MQLHAGDVIEVVSNKVGVPPRHGTVLRVVQEDPLKIEVEWSDDHTSVLEPSGGNVRVVTKRS